MGPIEVLWITLWIIFGFIGLARGFPKELGVTVMVLIAMVVLVRFGDALLGLVDRLFRLFGLGFLGTPREGLFAWHVFILFLLLIVFIAYEGETLAFPGQAPKGMKGRLLNMGAGLLNGYLIVGTIWYYLDVYDYPAQMLGLYQPPLSPVAEFLVSILPLSLLPPDLAEVYLALAAIFLLILRVLP